MSEPESELPFTLEFSLGELRDSAAARRRQALLEAAPQIQAHYENLTKRASRGLEGVDESISTEALQLYNRVVEDGRFVDLVRTDPGAAAEALGIAVNPETIDVVSRVNSELAGPVEGPVEAVIAVAVVVVLAPKLPAGIDPGIVIDENVTLRRRL